MPCTWTASGRPNSGAQSFATAVRHGVLYIALACGSTVVLYKDTTIFIQILDLDKTIDCVAFDRRTGCIAVSCDETLTLFHERYSSYEETICWTQGHRSTLDGGRLSALSWGIDQELLAANAFLTLHAPAQHTTALDQVWQFPLADPACDARFSPDGSLVASFQQTDRLVKVWRRLPDRTTAGGTRQADFDFLYLVHPQPVTAMKWRQPFQEDLRVDNILYTCCADGFLRIWASDVPHDSHLLTLHETIDLRAEAGSWQTPAVLDDDVFSWAAAKAVARGGKQAQATLADMSKGTPEFIMLLSAKGLFELHGCYHLGSRTHKASSQRLVYASKGSVLETQALDWMAADISRAGDEDLLFFCATKTHIGIYGMQLDALLGGATFKQLGMLGGHAKSITRVQRTSAGFCSADEHETLYWTAGQSLNLSEPTDVYAAEAFPDHLDTHAIYAHTASYTALVTKNDPEILCIYHGDAAAHEISQLPECTVKLQGTVQQLCWTRLDSDGFLALAVHVTTQQGDHISIFRPDHARLWQCYWQTQMTTLTITSVSAISWTSTSDAVALVVAAGAQLFLFEQAQLKQASTENACENLPIYHPLVMESLLLLSVDLLRVGRILSLLYEQIVASRTIEPMLGFSEADWPSKCSVMTASADTEQVRTPFDAAKADSLCALLAESNLVLPGLSTAEQIEVGVWGQVLVKLQAPASVLDAMAQRFLIILIHRSLQDTSARLSSAHLLWAYLSETQSALVDLVIGEAGGLTWHQAASTGLLFWIRDEALLIRVGDMIARNEYLTGGSFQDGKLTERNPVAASLWMLALRQRSQLVSLWRISQHLKEAGPTLRVLQNDFTDARWRTTANKNAFALLGKQRDVYAAAWFLLAGRAEDARRVLVKFGKAKDEGIPWHLANSVLRLYDATADDEAARDALRRCLEEDVQRDAEVRGDLFLLVQVQLMLGETEEALALLLGKRDVRRFAQAQAMESDPVARWTVYVQLRARSTQSVDEALEAQLRANACRRLRRRGVGFLADEMKKMTLPALSMSEAKSAPEGPAVTSQEDRTLESYLEAQKGKLSEAPKAVFQEPTMDSFAAFDF